MGENKNKPTLEHLGEAQEAMERTQEEEIGRREQIKLEAEKEAQDKTALFNLERLLPTLKKIGKLDTKLRTFSDYTQKRFSKAETGSIERSHIREVMELVTKYIKAIENPDSTWKDDSTDDINKELVDSAVKAYSNEYGKNKYSLSDDHRNEYLRQKIIISASQQLEDTLDNFFQYRIAEQPRLRRWMHGGAVKDLKRKESKG